MRRIVLHQMLCDLLSCMLSPSNLKRHADLSPATTSLTKAEIHLRRAIARHPYHPQLHCKLVHASAGHNFFKTTRV